MPRLSRRSFIAASAALLARPAFAAKPAGEDADVIVIGAGAAGLAAARRLTAEKMRVLVFEASDRIGGRCATDTKAFGVPFDLGAHWIHNPDGNPLLAGGRAAGFDVYAAPRWQNMRIGPRDARDAELEYFLAAWCGRSARIARAAHRQSRHCGRAAAAEQPRQLASDVEFMLGPYACGKGSRRGLRCRSCARRSSATRPPSAGRATARCWRSSPPACRSAVDAGDADRLGPRRRRCDHRQGPLCARAR